MLRYIIGGVALAATGYGLKKYIDKFDAHLSLGDQIQSDAKDPGIKDKHEMIFKSFTDDNSLVGKAMDKGYKFNETINRLFISLKILQEKLSGIENLPELKSAYASISGEKILKFNEIDCKNFNKFLYLFIDTKEDLQILCDLNLMINYALEYMIESNISKLDASHNKRVSDYEKFSEEQQEIVIKLIELNNRLVKALRELRMATHMTEIATIFKDTATAYKRYYDKKFFKEEIYE